MYNCQRSTIKIDTGDKNLSLRFLYWQSIYFYPKKLTWTKTNFHLYNQGTYYAVIICVLKPKTVEGTFQKKKWTFIILVFGAKCGGIRNWMRQSIDLTTIFTKIKTRTQPRQRLWTAYWKLNRKLFVIFKRWRVLSSLIKQNILAIAVESFTIPPWICMCTSLKVKI